MRLTCPQISVAKPHPTQNPHCIRFKGAVETQAPPYWTIKTCAISVATQMTQKMALVKRP